MNALALALAALYSIQEIPLEEAYRTIEARTEARKRLTADIEIGGGLRDMGLRVRGRVECVRGGGLRRIWVIWAGSEALFLVDENHGLRKRHPKAALSAREEGAFFVAGKIDPAAPLDLGELNNLLLMIGMPAILIDVALFPRLLESYGSPAKAEQVAEEGRNLLRFSTPLEARRDRTTARWIFRIPRGALPSHLGHRALAGREGDGPTAGDLARGQVAGGAAESLSWIEPVPWRLSSRGPGVVSSRPVEFLREPAATKAPDAVLLAARAFVRGGHLAEATEAYATLAGIEELRRLGPEAAPLLFEARKKRSGEARSRIRAILLDYARKALRERFRKS